MLLISDDIKMIKIINRVLSINQIKLDLLPSDGVSNSFTDLEQYLAILIDTRGLSSGSYEWVTKTSLQHGVPFILLEGSYYSVKRILSLVKRLIQTPFRYSAAGDENIWLNPYVAFDVNKHQVIRGDLVIPLPSIEYKLLYVLCEKSPCYISTDQLLDIVWGGR